MKHCLCTTTFGAIGQIFDPFYTFFKTKLILFYSSEQSWQSQKYFKRNFKISCRGGALKKDDCSGKGLRIWLENLRILNFATHILWFSICIFLKTNLKNTKEIQNILQKIQNGGIRF
jgi:hypothetical protein